MAAACLLGVQTLQAAVVFTAGDETVLPGGSVGVPVSVTGFTDVTTFQFSLHWDEDVLQYSSVGSHGLPSLSGGNFGTGDVALGTLTVSWNYDPTGVLDDSIIFAVNFTALGAAGTQSAITFDGTPTPWEVTVNYGIADYGSVNGNVTVVPEPVNFALAVFGLLLAGRAAARWVARRRAA